MTSWLWYIIVIILIIIIIDKNALAPFNKSKMKATLVNWYTHLDNVKVAWVGVSWVEARQDFPRQPRLLQRCADESPSGTRLVVAIKGNNILCKHRMAQQLCYIYLFVSVSWNNHSSQLVKF